LGLVELSSGDARNGAVNQRDPRRGHRAGRTARILPEDGADAPFGRGGFGQIGYEIEEAAPEAIRRVMARRERE
jgi:hypothetical protein